MRLHEVMAALAEAKVNRRSLIIFGWGVALTLMSWACGSTDQGHDLSTTVTLEPSKTIVVPMTETSQPSEVYPIATSTPTQVVALDATQSYATRVAIVENAATVVGSDEGARVWGTVPETCQAGDVLVRNQHSGYVYHASGYIVETHLFRETSTGHLYQSVDLATADHVAYDYRSNSLNSEWSWFLNQNGIEYRGNLESYTRTTAQDGPMDSGIVHLVGRVDAEVPQLTAVGVQNVAGWGELVDKIIYISNHPAGLPEKQVVMAQIGEYGSVKPIDYPDVLNLFINEALNLEIDRPYTTIAGGSSGSGGCGRVIGEDGSGVYKMVGGVVVIPGNNPTTFFIEDNPVDIREQDELAINNALARDLAKGWELIVDK